MFKYVLTFLREFLETHLSFLCFNGAGLSLFTVWQTCDQDLGHWTSQGLSPVTENWGDLSCLSTLLYHNCYWDAQTIQMSQYESSLTILLVLSWLVSFINSIKNVCFLFELLNSNKATFFGLLYSLWGSHSKCPGVVCHSLLQLWELDCKEGRTPKNSYLWTLVLEKTPESSLDSKKIKPVNAKGDQL